VADTPYFDLLIVAPLEEEIDAVFRHFEPKDDLSKNSHLIYRIDLGAEHCTALAVQLPEWGRSQASSTIGYICTQYRFGLIACVGIAGALSDDLSVGDVCYSGSIIDVHDRSKVAETETKNIDMNFVPKFFASPNELTCALNFIRTNPRFSSAYKEWRKSQF
jgi:nucleoside phosphorylase